MAATAAAFQLFKWLGAKWLTAKFEERLAVFKAEKDQELEKLRAEINRMLDRAAKFNAKEYEILPEAWKLLTAALGETAYVVSGLKRRPDVQRMGEAEFNEFLDKSDLAEWQKKELRQASDRSRWYSQHCSWNELNAANKALTDYNNYVLLNDIFIENEVADKMSKIAQDLRMAAVLVESSLDGMGTMDSWKEARQYQQNAGKLVDELRQSVRSRISDVRLISRKN